LGLSVLLGLSWDSSDSLLTSRRDIGEAVPVRLAPGDFLVQRLKRVQ
jgi:hypothetical protein